MQGNGDSTDLDCSELFTFRQDKVHVFVVCQHLTDQTSTVVPAGQFPYLPLADATVDPAFLPRFAPLMSNSGVLTLYAVRRP